LDLKFPAAADMVAMRNYTQEYSYDEAGNITVFDHQANGNGYKRTYRYNNNDADRLACGVVDGRPKNNQLLRTTVKGVDTDYTHDVHGNMTSMPHLAVMDWNYRDQLKRTAKTIMNDGKPGMTFYVYDSKE
jgi:hypothetical protein